MLVAGKLQNNEFFCREISEKQLITNHHKIIKDKSIILFSDCDIKRLSYNKHLLVDGTFIYPSGYKQTVIIMYFDEILNKMIPGVFILLNNKYKEGYKNVLFNT